MSEHADLNRAAWTAWAPDWVAAGRRSWEDPTPSWGVWGIPEAELALLPDVTGLDTIELGCGTGYISAWLARLGARPVGIDITPAQLATARAFQEEFGVPYQLIEASAEAVPFPDSSFDLAISEYGAATWCDPYRWIPEAARLLRPGGWLVFLANSVLSMLCSPEEDLPVGDRLVRDQFGLHRVEYPDPPTVEFSIPHGAMIALLRGAGFEVLRLVELQAPEGATTRHAYVSPEWARRWPIEEAWVARKR